MEDKENKPKLLSCMVKGPGPAYKLPALVGYVGHDPSKPRYPAYTMRPNTSLNIPSFGPGPQYNVTRLTKHGRDNPPAYTILGREHFKVSDRGPGPGAHSPELCPPMNHNKRAPAYSIKSKNAAKLLDTGPGPSAYLLPTCIGPKIPDKRAQAAFTIAGNNGLRADKIGPGPAGYGGVSYDTIKRRCPAFTVRGRHKLLGNENSPGPAYYPRYFPGKAAPVYTFGIRHSECAGTPITSLDDD